MNDDVTRTLLLIEDSPSDAEMIIGALGSPESAFYRIECFGRLSEGIERLRSAGIAAVLVDLFLPDSSGIETLEKIIVAAPHLPILVLADGENETTASQIARLGGPEYLLKGYFNKYSFHRALRSVIERKSAEEALFLERDRAHTTLNCIRDGVLSTDLLGNVTYLNVVAEQMTGWSRSEAMGHPFSDVFRTIDQVSRLPSRNPMEVAVAEDRKLGPEASRRLIRRDGIEADIENSAAPIHDRQGRVTGAVIVFHEVSAARSMVLQMAYSAEHDFLTDLPNRMLMLDRITQAISLADRHGTQVAVLFLDLDGFKRINDSLGHSVGDKLLQMVAARLTACIRNSDTVSRQGGDEFVVLLSEVKQAEDAAATSAAKMLAALATPHHIDQHEVYISASIGMASYPRDGKDAETLLKHADTAMYYAKEGGRNQYHFFSKAMNVRAVERQSIESSLRRAIGRDEFLLHFQPKVNLKTEEITGSEALIRWMHPDRGLISPLDFIPIAEESGLVLPIGRWVLAEACRQSKAWQDAGLQVVPVAVNVSGVEFRSKDFLAFLRSILEETHLDPRLLEIELRESVLMQQAESSGTMLKDLKAMGVRLTIDDFGTGYSSLGYLKQFPIDTLKVDQSFVREVTARTDDAAIVSAVISMARSLGQLVIAEGVETAAQLAFLRSRECDEGQGFYFSRPMEAREFAALLKKSSS